MQTPTLIETVDAEQAAGASAAEPPLPGLPSMAYSAAQDDSREYEARLSAYVSSSPALRAASFYDTYLLFPSFLIDIREF